MSTKPYSIVVLIGVAAALSATAALAQTTATADAGHTQFLAPGADLLQQPQLPELKSEGAALRLSLLGTLVPMALGFALAGGDPYDSSGDAGALLIYSGLYIGPSLGYFYAGKSGRGLASFGLRNGIALISLVGAFAICGPMAYCDDSEVGAATVVLLVGAIGILSSAIYDIANVRKSVRQRNEKELAKSVAMMPTWSPRDGPGFRVSLAVR